MTVHNALLVQVSAGLASLLPISPSGIGTEQAFLLYLLRDQASRTALLAFSVGMRITLIVVNLALGFTALFVTLRTVHWREHAARLARSRALLPGVRPRSKCVRSVTELRRPRGVRLATRLDRNLWTSCQGSDPGQARPALWSCA